MKDLTITRKEWNGYTVVSEATASQAVVKSDSAGIKWQWINANKRVTVKRIK